MLEVAGWIAPAATMVAALMTAANLGSRVTGWGFVVFTVGAIAWTTVGIATGQRNIVLSNGFLFVVDLVGVWRWLGRRARYDAGADDAGRRAAAAAVPALFAGGTLAGRMVVDAAGRVVGEVVDAMLCCETGAVRYLVVSEGGVAGVGERLHAVGWREVRLRGGRIELRAAQAPLARRAPLDPVHWPVSAEAAGVA